MGPHPVATIARPPRNVRMARRPASAHMRPTAVVIECEDSTCTVVGSGFSRLCHSKEEAMRAVEEVASSVLWRETSPGFWVARIID